MAASSWIGLGSGTAAAVYGVYGLVTGTGAAGWVNYAQQSLMGSYSMKLTAVVLMLAVAAIGVGAFMLAEALGLEGSGGGAGAMAAAQRLAAPSKPMGYAGFLGVAAGMVAATWVIGFAVYWWNTRSDAEDAKATYQSIVLADGMALPALNGEHLALSGRLLGEKVLSHTRGKSSTAANADYHYVPIAPPGWKEGQPVRYVVKVKHLPDLGPQFGGMRVWVPPNQRRETAPGAPPPVLGRLDGEVPVPAAQAFKGIGVPLDDKAQVVRWVPSRNGEPMVRDSSDEDRQIMLVLCGGISAVLVLTMLVAGWASQRQQRRLRQQQGAVA